MAEREIIEKSAGGAADEDELNKRIASVWGQMLADPTTKKEVADLLGCNEDALKSDQPPVVAEVKAGGMTGAEILIAIAVGFALGVAEKTGEAAGKAVGAKIVKLWNDKMRRRVSPPGSGVMARPEEQERS